MASKTQRRIKQMLDTQNNVPTLCKERKSYINKCILLVYVTLEHTCYNRRDIMCVFGDGSVCSSMSTHNNPPPPPLPKKRNLISEKQPYVFQDMLIIFQVSWRLLKYCATCVLKTVKAFTSFRLSVFLS